MASSSVMEILEEETMDTGPAPPKISWTPVLLTIGAGIFVAVASFIVVTSQWGHPTSPIATAGFFGILLGLLILSAGCIWLLAKILAVMKRLR